MKANKDRGTSVGFTNVKVGDYEFPLRQVDGLEPGVWGIIQPKKADEDIWDDLLDTWNNTDPSEISFREWVKLYYHAPIKKVNKG